MLYIFDPQYKYYDETIDNYYFNIKILINAIA